VFPWLRKRRRDADFAAEVQAHLDLETARLMQAGMGPEQARLAARRDFGNVAAAQERFHDSRRPLWLESLRRDVRYAWRGLSRSPLFSAAAILTFGLGIGATTAVFTLVYGVLLRPMPFAQPDRLVDLSHTLVVSGLLHVDQSDATYLHYRRANHVFSGVGAYQALAVNLGAGGTSDASGGQRVPAARATASAFQVLGVTPLRGRLFTDAEDQPGQSPVALIGRRLWASRYGSDPAMVGKRIRIDGVSHEVIGIMPAGFAFPDAGTQLWLPAGIDPARTNSAVFGYRGVARLRAGVTPEAAEHDLQALLPQVPEVFPGRLTAGAITATHMRPVVRPLRDTIVGDIGRVLWVVLGAVACLLLIACANVANLFLVRAVWRRHDTAVRLALGAGRGALTRGVLVEGLLLATAGGGLGLGLAAGGIRVLQSLETGVSIPRLGEVGIDGVVLAAVGGITLLAALLVGMIPALRAGRSSLVFILTQSGRAVSPGRDRHRAQRALVVVQVALALVLVTGAGLMGRSWRNLRAVRPGFDARSVYTLRVALPPGVYPAASDAARAIMSALDAMGQLPGVRAAGVVAKLPLDDEARRDTAVFVSDRSMSMGALPGIHQLNFASPGYFDAMGIPLLSGRTFERPDGERAPLEVIVTRALAQRYWKGEPALGRKMRFTPVGPEFTVVAVTGDVLGGGLDQKPDEAVYLPLMTAPGPADATGAPGTARFTPREVAFVVRSAGASRTVAGPVEQVLHSLSPDLPVYHARPMDEVVAHSAARTSFTLQLLSIASLAALVLGAIGIYAVIAHMVTLRRREIAVRIALGARPRDVRRMVSRQAVAIAAAGVVIGLGAAALLTRFLAALLFGVARGDTITFLVATAVLGGVAAAASWLPARRAAAVDPAVTLQAE